MRAKLAIRIAQMQPQASKQAANMSTTRCARIQSKPSMKSEMSKSHLSLLFQLSVHLAKSSEGKQRRAGAQCLAC